MSVGLPRFHRNKFAGSSGVVFLLLLVNEQEIIKAHFTSCLVAI